MKKVLVLLCLILLAVFSFTSSAFSDQVTLAWDPNDPTPEGYRIFDRPEGGAYDYSIPAWQGPETTATVEVLGEAMKSMKYYFVVRAYEGNLESADSIEVEYTVDRTPPEKVTSLSASYDRAASSISLSFTQVNPVRARYWKIYYTFTSGKDYQEFDTIQKSTSNDGKVQLTKPFTAVAKGERRTVYFTVIGFYEPKSFSANSEEVSVDVNHKIIVAPANIRITAAIPVQ